MGTARLSAACLLLPWIVGCGPGPITLADGGDDATDGSDDATAGSTGTPTGGSSSTSTSATTTTGTGDTGDTTTGGACSTPPAADLGNGVPAFFEAPTWEFGNDDASECGGEEAPDFYVLWTAPEAGTYVFETAGSDFDTVLHLRDGACGPLLDCNDDAFEVDSRVTYSLEAGQTVAVVVDGYFDSAGFAFLSIRQVQQPEDCPDEDLPPIFPLTVYADSSVDTNELWSECGGFDGPEHTWRFVAPYSGLFRFDTLGSPFDTVLYLHDGICGGFELACNDDAPQGGLHSQVDVFLDEGQEVIVVVDDLGSQGGPIQLNITGDEGGGQCPDFEVGPGGFGFESFGSGNDYAGACGGGAGPDVTHRFVAPYPAIWFFQIEYSDFQPALDVLTSCGGPSLGCDGIGWGFGGAGVARYLDAGEEAIAVVDSRSGEPGYYELVIDEIACPQQWLWEDVPQQILGSTAVSVNAIGASCGGDESPERTYQFVAPFSGQYRIATQGSQYDTLLHVRDGGCGGAELACNDDVPEGLWSQVVVSLSAGQDITIAVDGFGGDAGQFALVIEPL